MARAENFGFFDPRQPYSVYYGKLPHWEQPGATYFLTFRTADSIPLVAMELWERERDEWLARRGIRVSHGPWYRLLAQQPLELQREFHRIFAEKYERTLDECHGECWLRRPEIAKIVADSLLHFDGDLVDQSLRDGSTKSWDATREIRYHVADFVIMPNHVHVLVCFKPHVRLRNQCYSWKHFTAVRIHRALGRSGEFWQSESFDHLVRDPEHFQRFRNYIADNPKEAGLRANETLWYSAKILK
jgi:menaquinone-specific isochorismate synthase